MRLIWARPRVCLIADQQLGVAVNLIQNLRSGDLRYPYKLCRIKYHPYQARPRRQLDSRSCGPEDYPRVFV